MRRFANRSKVMDHLHEKSDVCLVNLLLYHKPVAQAEVDEANEKQYLEEAGCRNRAERHSYSDELSAQEFGPLNRFVIPVGHSHQARFPLMRKALQRCPTSSGREVDFVALRGMLGLDEIPEGEEVDNDDLPLDVLAAALC